LKGNYKKEDEKKLVEVKKTKVFTRNTKVTHVFSFNNKNSFVLKKQQNEPSKIPKREHLKPRTQPLPPRKRFCLSDKSN